MKGRRTRKRNISKEWETKQKKVLLKRRNLGIEGKETKTIAKDEGRNYR